MAHRLDKKSFLYMTAEAVKRDRPFVVVCREDGTPSQGGSLEEAFGNLEAALWIKISVLRQDGYLEGYVKEHHLRVGKLDHPERKPESVEVPEGVFAVRRMRIPVDPEAAGLKPDFLFSPIGS